MPLCSALNRPWLIALWLRLVGAVGSFLNVVVYRLPAGMSIVWPGSHCPLCQHPIRWFDNMPVLSWILLRRPLPRLPRARSRSAIRWSRPARPRCSSCWPSASSFRERRQPAAGPVGSAERRAALGHLCLSPAAAVYAAGRGLIAIRRPSAARRIVPAGAGGRPGGPGVLARGCTRGRLARDGRLHGPLGGLARRRWPGWRRGGRVGRLAGGPAAAIRGCALAAACVGLVLGWQAACGLVAADARSSRG